jgi:D-glycerate 3-kinase
VADSPLEWQTAFLERHRLPALYLQHAQFWFDPLAGALSLHQKSAGRSVLVAINGCQGSGKTTLCDYLRAILQAEYGVRAVALSLDDFYLTREQRRRLAAEVHPLLATRGVPGTHDIDLLNATLDGLLAPPGSDPVAVPRFDKAVDDRRPPGTWDTVKPPVELILLEGWCLGAQPQPAAVLAEPVNELERVEDPDGRWRTYVNEALQRDFTRLYQRVDRWVMLQAPSFACVRRWRLEQEQKLAATTVSRESGTGRAGLMNETELARFIQHYQRLTEDCLARLPERVHYLYRLDEERQITAGNHPGNLVQ